LYQILFLLRRFSLRKSVNPALKFTRNNLLISQEQRSSILRKIK